MIKKKDGDEITVSSGQSSTIWWMTEVKIQDMVCQAKKEAEVIDS
jgi:hypothetical protein